MMPLTGELNATGGPLRIAIVLDSYNVSAWIASVVDDLLSAAFLEVTAIVTLPEPLPGQGRDERRPSRNWLFRHYAAWEKRREGAGDPLRTVDISAQVAPVLCAQRIEEVAAQDLDVLVWLAARAPGPALKETARFGIWLYRHGESAYFWEIYQQNPVTRPVLEVLHEGADDPQVLTEAYLATVQGWSWRQNREIPYWKASAFMLSCLEELDKQEDRGAWTLSRAASSPGALPAKSEPPSNLQMASFFLRNAARTISRRLRYSQKESHWFVAYRTDRNKFVANSEALDLRGFQRIRSPQAHFYADPFVIQWAGRDYLFIEDYPFAERKGCISVMEISAQGGTTKAERVLDLPYHLSYPFVFEHDGELYMIPETLGAGRVELYHARDVPTRWELVKVLREDVQAVDTTLWVENGQFYFFTNMAGRGATVDDELCLFSANDLLGEWKPHPKNPIVSDVRRSRGAGKLFRRNGRLIRPAQDCSVRYGYACQLNEIELLTPLDYRERPLRRIEPDWAPGLIGTHTINSNERFEVIDGQFYGKRYGGRQNPDQGDK